MIEEQVIVTKIEDEFAWVKTATANSSCDSCSASGGCGISMMSKLLSRRQETEFKVRNVIGAQTGDSAIMGIPETTFIKGALLMYFLPLCCLLFSALLAKWLLNPTGDLPIIIAGMLGLAGSLIWLRFRHISTETTQSPVLSTITHHSSSL